MIKRLSDKRLRELYTIYHEVQSLTFLRDHYYDNMLNTRIHELEDEIDSKLYHLTLDFEKEIPATYTDLEHHYRALFKYLITVGTSPFITRITDYDLYYNTETDNYEYLTTLEEFRTFNPDTDWIGDKLLKERKREEYLTW